MFKTLYHNHLVGYAVCCTQCNCLQISFGNLLLNLDNRDFISLKKRVSNTMENAGRVENTLQKCITISTPCDAIKILLNYNELVALYEMLEEVDTELKVYSLLNLFE